MTREQQIELVRKCLALTASPYPAEAEAARLKAEALVRKFGITKAELQPPKPRQRQCPGCAACRAGVRVRGLSLSGGSTISTPAQALAPTARSGKEEIDAET